MHSGYSIIWILYLSGIHLASGFPEGAPLSTCDDMQPNPLFHRQPQEGQSPYGINIADGKTTYGDGDDIISKDFKITLCILMIYHLIFLS